VSETKIGIIGGSGLYQMEGFATVEELDIDTPFGAPSGPYVLAEMGNRRVAFLARHGEGHSLLPGDINYRANIYGFKKLGVERVIGVSAVGSMRSEIQPLQVVLPDQFIDRTRGRKDTFFGGGIAAHVSFADPVCPELQQVLARAAEQVSATVHRGGTYLCMEGPAFSTRAESMLYRSWGVSIIGMTNIQEAKLAREAEICYATVALVTDYDCWHETEAEVSVEMLLEHLTLNAQTAQCVLKAAVPAVPENRSCPCCKALNNAIITSPDKISAETKNRLEIIIGKYIE